MVKSVSFIISSTALELLNEAINSADGNIEFKKFLHCPNDCGCEKTFVISDTSKFDCAIKQCLIVRTDSPLINRSKSCINKSSVDVTPPSILFSIGTIPWSTFSSETYFATACIESTGINSAVESQFLTASSL